jgi:hypothetical protein
MEFRGQTSYKDRHCWPATKVNLKSGMIRVGTALDDQVKTPAHPAYEGEVFCSIFVNHKKGS